MTESRFHVLDRVMVEGVGGPPQMGVITQVRLYPDGGFRYGVSVDDGIIADEASLSSTGEREPIESYVPPGTLFPWDEVEIQKDDRILRGIVDGWFEDEGIAKYTVWVPLAREMEICEEKDMVRIGRSGMRRSGPARSTRVSESGEVLGTTQYVILEDLMDVIADNRPR